MRGVDARLAADGGIDLRQQRGRHLHEIHAAPHDAGGEAGQIADDAAAERDHHVAAFEPRRQHPVDHVLQRRKALGLFAGRQHDRGHADTGVLQAFGEPRQMPGRHVLVGHDRGARAGQALGDRRAGLSQQPGADKDVVAALAERDLNRFDRLSGHFGFLAPARRLARKMGGKRVHHFVRRSLPCARRASPRSRPPERKPDSAR